MIHRKLSTVEVCNVSQGILHDDFTRMHLHVRRMSEQQDKCDVVCMRNIVAHGTISIYANLPYQLPIYQLPTLYNT